MRVMSLIAGSLLIAGAATVGSSAAVAGAGTQATAAPNQQSSSEDRSRRVCRSVTPSGTRLPIRTCRTQAEWDEQAAQARHRMEEQNRSAFNEEANRANRNYDDQNR